ncbi:hypothetical protein C475_00115 [Halosimplex carlsbadense 2-9-1]|uniref:Uncharacterized protein n=1 Tax=Halosimplex carlsbadense 2-9-1 TaxID=797114 RepID=M0D4W1_9EURY|nr:hypothetical protein [Halosimplex carlsbadense]ELZ30501.1 hypothetical protein C475_00115 [Halosimplex carlsbadense 2-9-1]
MSLPETESPSRGELLFNLTRKNATGCINVTAEYDRSNTGPNSTAYLVVEDIDPTRSRQGGASDRKLRRFDGKSGTLSIEVLPTDGYDSENVMVTAYAENTTLDLSLTVRRDRDDDGMYDFRERQTYGFFVSSENPEIDTEVDDPDTDGDGAEDGLEVRDPVEIDRTATVEFDSVTRSVEFDGLFLIPQSHPNYRDTDSDGLNDETEIRDWEIPVEIRNGEAYRWAPGGSNESIEAESSPLLKDTDGDGLDDAAEKNRTHTNPNATTTYGITSEHERLLRDLWVRYRTGGSRIGAFPPSVDSFDDIELSDATDDFDFVFDDTADGASTLDRFDFRALDGTNRTDTFLSNRREVAIGTDPWDPDTDDDGLTDGQEIEGTSVVRTYAAPGVPDAGTEIRIDDTVPHTGLSPLNPDSDGDGYWDGWIGVYNVSYDHGRGIDHAENLVLYREHLQSGNGTTGDEILQEQIKIHNTTEVSSAAGADVDDDGVVEHSNVHVGELLWDTSPVGGSSPDLNVTVEADYLEGLPEKRLNNTVWENGIEENLALYSINLDIIRDDNVSEKAALTGIAPDMNTDLHLSVVNKNNIAGDATGYNLDASVVPAPLPLNGHMIYAQKFAQADYRNAKARLSVSPYNTETELYAAKTELHELGHSFNLGVVDDQPGPLPFSEVYSGKDADVTREKLENRPGAQWGVMSKGWRSGTVFESDGVGYYVYTLEELLSIRRP